MARPTCSCKGSEGGKTDLLRRSDVASAQAKEGWMDDADRLRVEHFLETWKGSQGNERANYQGFFLDLCDALGVDRPPPKGNIPGDPYAFDKDIRVIHKDGFSTNYADFYKAGHFLIEAKQGGNSSKRGTKAYDTLRLRSSRVCVDFHEPRVLKSG